MASFDMMQEMVSEFIEKFDAKDAALYRRLVDEESKEVCEAFLHLLKEVADYLYVFNGLNVLDTDGVECDKEAAPEVEKAAAITKLLLLTMKPAVIETFRRVHESNMSKLDDDGKPIRREDGKVLKGPNYKPPVLTDLL
jgi:predicted HAD superfamily Cof-like phosphohydrolase